MLCAHGSLVVGFGLVSVLAGSAIGGLGGLNLIEASHETSLLSYLSDGETDLFLYEIDNSYHEWDGSPGYPAFVEEVSYLHNDGIEGAGRFDGYSNTVFGGSGADAYWFAFDTAMSGITEDVGVATTQVTAFTGTYRLIADRDIEVEVSLSLEFLGGDGSRSLKSDIGFSLASGESIGSINLPDDGEAFAEELVFRTSLSAGQIVRFGGGMYASQGSEDDGFVEWDLEGLSVSGSIVVVPAPGSVGLIGLCGMMGARRRR